MSTRSQIAYEGHDGGSRARDWPGALYGDLGWPSDQANVQRYVARGRRLQAEAISAALRSVVVTLKRGFDSWRVRRRTVSELSRLDDHMLRDIGISREQIPYIAEGLIGPTGTFPRQPVQATRYEAVGDRTLPPANDTPTRGPKAA